MADIDLDKAPESTWGAPEDYKQAWHREYGNVSPSASASKAEWVEFATKNGMSAEEAEASTRAALVEQYGADTVYDGGSAPTDATAQGSGEDPAPSDADPSNSAL